MSYCSNLSEITVNSLNENLENYGELSLSVESWLAEHVVPKWNYKQIVDVSCLPDTGHSVGEINKHVLWKKGLQIMSKPLPFFLALESVFRPAKFKSRNVKLEYYVCALPNNPDSEIN